jgi:hypothetical protein
MEEALVDLHFSYETRPSPDLARMIEQLAAEITIRELRRIGNANRPAQPKEGA